MATRNNLRHFTKYYLRSDGFFLLRILAKNTNELFASDILVGLWKEYQKSRVDIYTLNKNELDIMELTEKDLNLDPATKLPKLESKDDRNVGDEKNRETIYPEIIQREMNVIKEEGEEEEEEKEGEKEKEKEEKEKEKKEKKK